jgi:hypothetical protein
MNMRRQHDIVGAAGDDDDDFTLSRASSNAPLSIMMDDEPSIAAAPPHIATAAAAARHHHHLQQQPSPHSSSQQQPPPQPKSTSPPHRRPPLTQQQQDESDLDMTGLGGSLDASFEEVVVHSKAAAVKPPTLQCVNLVSIIKSKGNGAPMHRSKLSNTLSTTPTTPISFTHQHCIPTVAYVFCCIVKWCNVLM